MNLVRELEGYEGVYLDGPRAAVVIADDRSRARAAARLTVLGGVDVNIVSSSSACRRGTLVSLSDDARRAAWTPLRLDVDTNVRTAHGKSVLVVSSAPASHAAVLRAQASGPLTTYGTSHASQVMDMLAVCALPHVIVLDGDLEGTDGVDERIRALYPSRFGAFGRVQWMSGKKGLSDDDVERILEAVGMRPHPTLARDEPFRTFACSSWATSRSRRRSRSLRRAPR